MSKIIKYNWSTLAAEYEMDYRTLKLNCKAIMKKLDDCVKPRKNYRNLTPKQVEIIKNHIG
jgi:hypothetical protein